MPRYCRSTWELHHTSNGDSLMVMKQNRPVETVDDQVFVYGTLKPGESRWAMLAPYVREAIPGFVRGFSVCCAEGISYPFIKPAEDGIVRGYLCPLVPDTASQAIKLLDSIEGYDPRNVSDSLFVRERVLVTTTDGQNAESYAWGYRAGLWLALEITGARVLADGIWTKGDM